MKKILTLSALILMSNFLFSQWTTSEPNIYNSNTGNVGLGTTSPAHLLDVRGSIYTNANLIIDGGDLVLKRTTNAFGYVVRPNQAGYKKLQFAVEGGGPLDDLYLNANTSYFTGNVGIGTAAPAAKLQVVGSRISLHNTGEARYHLYNGGATVEWVMGQKSSSLHNYTISTSVAGNEVDMLSISTNGNVGIGTTNPGSHKLAVEGKIGAREVKVTLANPWPDYVFHPKYELLPLSDLEKFIQQHKHLPNIPSAQEVKENDGIDLGEMNAKLLEKIEELTLYIIELKKENNEIKERLNKIE